jgi:TRAP-type C4-dicarboxylate transport system substrate-binding protein
MKVYSQFPPGSGPTTESEMMINLLTEQSNGRITGEVFPGGALGKPNDILDMLKSGICQIAATPLPMFPTKFQIAQAAEQPMLGQPNWAVATHIREDLYAAGYTQGFEDVKFLAYNIQRPQCVYLTKKVLKAEDFKGLKVRAPDPTHIKAFEPFGLTAVSMSMGDVYMSLERGVIDGACTGAPENFVNVKWHEVLKYAITNPLAYGGTCMLMSQETWNSLPADLKLVVEQIIPQWRYQGMMYYRNEDVRGYAELEKAGVDVYQVDPSEYARWQELAKPVVDKWIADREAEGLPGKEVIDLIHVLVKLYS